MNSAQLAGIICGSSILLAIIVGKATGNHLAHIVIVLVGLTIAIILFATGKKNNTDTPSDNSQAASHNDNKE